MHVIWQLYELHPLRLERSESDMAAHRVDDHHVAEFARLGHVWRMMIVINCQIIETDPQIQLISLPLLLPCLILLPMSLKDADHILNHMDMPVYLSLRVVRQVALHLVRLTSEAAKRVHELEHQSVLVLELFDLLALPLPVLFLLELAESLLLALLGDCLLPLLCPVLVVLHHLRLAGFPRWPRLDRCRLRAGLLALLR